MADAPFRRARRGDPLNGYSSEVYNAVLDLLGSRLDAPSAYRPFTSTEPGVLNSSGSALTTRFQILKVADPATTQAQNDSEFAEARIMSGVTPAVGSAFVVVQEPLSANVIGRATLLGLTPVKVNVTDTTHRYADCTTSLTKLTSAATGPARILWTENSFAVGDNQWAVVELLGPSVASGPTLPPVTLSGGINLATVQNFDFALPTPAAATWLITGSITVHISGGTADSVPYIGFSLTNPSGGTAYGGPWKCWNNSSGAGGGYSTVGGFGAPTDRGGAISVSGWFVTTAGQSARFTLVGAGGWTAGEVAYDLMATRFG